MLRLLGGLGLLLSVGPLFSRRGQAVAFANPPSPRSAAIGSYVSFTRLLSLLLPTTASTFAQHTSTLLAAGTSPSALFSTSSSVTSKVEASPKNSMRTGYLNSTDAAALDAELMSTPGYSLEQLMELAGLAVAEAVYQGLPAQLSDSTAKKRKILIVCGPGNNGGDGLVAARHLFFFNDYACTIVYPKRPSKHHFVNLVKQCEDLGIPLLNEMPCHEELQTFDAIVDAIFGFSFKGEPREPFATMISQMTGAQRDIDSLKVISVDVPSGWNVDKGDVTKTGFVPDMLVSLTTPKLCSKEFVGRHFVGGRFLPPSLASKYKVQMPPYPGTSQVMEVSREMIEG